MTAARVISETHSCRLRPFLWLNWSSSLPPPPDALMTMNCQHSPQWDKNTSRSSVSYRPEWLTQGRWVAGVWWV